MAQNLGARQNFKFRRGRRNADIRCATHNFLSFGGFSMRFRKADAVRSGRGFLRRDGADLDVRERVSGGEPGPEISDTLVILMPH